MYNKRAVGSEKEQMAAAYLTAAGYRILAANFFTRSGEVDLIAREEEALVFIEVKYRKDLQSGSPLEAIDSKKIRNICKAARYYMYINHIPEDTPCRFDVIGIVGEEVTLIRNAFDAQY
ncbi:YraN family protein [Anaerocolumna xylanovorans]|uniref:UPF0102 protein SAMN02745217_01153 n=1 Tax=Anaerocolumna xylanovorans DSM 12503 TaxID=1121345 RepID=A0A1M7Y293_9FIRM|nr:YraN family protein [Anaerocolumna xylanovorans]SHO46052.1 putative endonuclease [Anaerocolumna xylanovorans DSM 12503]